MRILRLIPVLVILGAGPATAAETGRVWAIALPKEGDAVLRYAFPDTKDLMLGLTCAKGTGQVQIVAASPVRLIEPVDPDAPTGTTPVAAQRPASIGVAAGAATATLPGRVGPDAVYGGSFVLTEISTASPVMSAFRKTRMLKVSALRESVETPPAPAAMLGKFLRFCR
jgi:hypothetical protein